MTFVTLSATRGKVLLAVGLLVAIGVAGAGVSAGCN